MQGSIRVDSKPDEGSEFIFTIQVEKSDEPSVGSKALDVSHIRALVVDDMDVAREVMTEALEALGITVDAVDSGEQLGGEIVHGFGHGLQVARAGRRRLHPPHHRPAHQAPGRHCA